jgi:hypothetical protein
MEIDVLPGDGGDFLDRLRALCIAALFFVLQKVGKERSVVKNDAIGNQAAAFRPEILLLLGLKTEFTEAGERDCTTELMIILTPVKGFLDMLSQCRRVNIVEQVKAAVNAVILPERPLCSAVAGVGTKFADNGALRGLLPRQGHEDAPTLIPFSDDVLLSDLPGGPQNGIAVAARMPESGQGCTCFVAEILVAGGKLVAEQM